MNVALMTDPRNEPEESLRKGERTRRAIVQAAIRTLCEQGYQALTVASVAEAAGIRRNSYYTYFGDLDELIGELSVQTLNRVGRRTALVGAAGGEPRSVTITRLRYVLSLREHEEPTAVVLSELYVHHADTAAEIHRRLRRDIATDRRRGLLRASAREVEMAAVVAAAGTMERLRRSGPPKAKEDQLYLSLIARLCGLSVVP